MFTADYSQAREHFEEAVKTGEDEYIEYDLAAFELERLGE